MGFGFRETMSGTWAPTGGAGERRPFAFTVRVASGPLGRFRADKVAAMTGTIDAAGLATRRELVGTMVLKPFLGRVIRYDFEFVGDDGRRYRFAGQKDIRWTDPLRTWTELPGELTDAQGAVIGKAQTRFDLRRDSAAFLLSFRPA